jgi:lipooligosaccharide transport system permease protein
VPTVVREPALGSFGWHLAVPVLYLAAFGSIALSIASRRLARMLLA